MRFRYHGQMTVNGGSHGGLAEECPQWLILLQAVVTPLVPLITPVDRSGLLVQETLGNPSGSFSAGSGGVKTLSSITASSKHERLSFLQRFTAFYSIPKTKFVLRQLAHFLYVLLVSYFAVTYTDVRPVFAGRDGGPSTLSALVLLTWSISILLERAHSMHRGFSRASSGLLVKLETAMVLVVCAALVARVVFTPIEASSAASDAVTASPLSPPAVAGLSPSPPPASPPPQGGWSLGRALKATDSEEFELAFEWRWEPEHLSHWLIAFSCILGWLRLLENVVLERVRRPPLSTPPLGAHCSASPLSVVAGVGRGASCTHSPAPLRAGAGGSRTSLLQDDRRRRALVDHLLRLLHRFRPRFLLAAALRGRRLSDTVRVALGRRRRVPHARVRDRCLCLHALRTPHDTQTEPRTPAPATRLHQHRGFADLEARPRSATSGVPP